jgi:hypothetical protein
MWEDSYPAHCGSRQADVWVWWIHHLGVQVRPTKQASTVLLHHPGLLQATAGSSKWRAKVHAAANNKAPSLQAHHSLGCTR